MTEQELREVFEAHGQVEEVHMVCDRDTGRPKGFDFVEMPLRVLKDYARANGYSVARESVDEAESGRVHDRPQFREMIEEGSKPKAPFDVILVWKFSRFTRKREHTVAFKSMLRRKGIRVVSITEQA